MKRTAMCADRGRHRARRDGGVRGRRSQDQQQQKRRRAGATTSRTASACPRATGVNNADGSWREEVKQGNCVTVKEKSASGEYKETRQCNPS